MNMILTHLYKMTKYYMLDSKRYRSLKGDLGKLNKMEKMELIRAGDLVPAKVSVSRPLATKEGGYRRRKCEKWGNVGNRATWQEAMTMAGGNPQRASGVYRARHVPASAVNRTDLNVHSQAPLRSKYAKTTRKRVDPSYRPQGPYSLPMPELVSMY